MRTYTTVILLLVFVLANSACKKETISENSSQKLQGSWRLLYSKAASGATQIKEDSSNLTILKFDGNNMLRYKRDSLISRETFLMALKSDHQPYLVADSDPWNPKIFSCTITGNDTLSLLSVHSSVHVGQIYVRVRP
ncbi:hypothetical protein SAMN05428949_4450 [Chitinophaga sp. YR627]|uniref:hypothetical protein n=1 Tax=Chitinophaga sp. YR627 TaxID=1881041 RepID=UPI0008F353F2|nr:hypothetical protein [Chitinophaga sp. YR627]SFO20268.1 hypothetical protein SAMN05428949_4450 [Chitinophaga sp. YR627]